MRQFLPFGVCCVWALSSAFPLAAQEVPPQDPATTQEMRGAVVLIELSPPTYPPLARQANIFGEVGVELSIRQDGTVASADAISGHPMLKQAALESAQKSHFECRGCGAGLTTFSLTYAFEMKDDGDCCSAMLRTAEVTQFPNHISIMAPKHCYCDPAATRIKCRSPKCLYLWRCGSRVTDLR